MWTQDASIATAIWLARTKPERFGVAADSAFANIRQKALLTQRAGAIAARRAAQATEVSGSCLLSAITLLSWHYVLLVSTFISQNIA
jgi:hypothetical protein